MNAPHESWMNRASDDLRFAELGLREGFYSQVCFLAQQAIEKSLKGSLVALGRPYPKSHSLRELARLVPELDLKSWQEELSLLDGYYVPLRYPDAAPAINQSGEPNKSEAAQALSVAQDIFDRVSKYLKDVVS